MINFGLYIANFHDIWQHVVMYYERELKLQSLIAQKSHFLLGPRSTGKSSLIRKTFGASLYINLLEQDTLREFIIKPSLLRERVAGQALKPGALVIIDEIQKIPKLLDEVHLLIEEKGLVFLLTGSAARKLKKGAANLLAGRAWMANLFPLISSEITDFNLIRYLNFGGLPQVYTSLYPAKELKNYINLYIKEEIQEEGLTRKLDQFLVFFDSIGLMSGEELNYQGWSSDTGVPRKTLQSYVELLKDTLMAFELPAFKKTITRKAVARSKFYLFDVGVANHMAKKGEIKEGSAEFGKAFEHFFIQECRALVSYLELDWGLTYWRSHSQMEVDLCLGQQWALEIKSSNRISDKHLKGLRALREEKLFKNYGVICFEKEKRIVDGITIWPWNSFLEEISLGYEDNLKPY